MAVTRSPWMGTVVLTMANTAYSLTNLLSALASDREPSLGGFTSVQYIAIQLDVSAGGAELFIGNENVSSTFCGVSIFGSQVWPIYSVEANLIQMSQIFLMSDTAGVRCNICFLVR